MFRLEKTRSASEWNWRGRTAYSDGSSDKWREAEQGGSTMGLGWHKRKSLVFNRSGEVEAIAFGGSGKQWAKENKPLRLLAVMFNLGEREISGYLERDRNVLLVQIDMNIQLRENKTLSYVRTSSGLDSKTGLDLGPTSPNNKFVERGRKN